MRVHNIRGPKPEPLVLVYHDCANKNCGKRIVRRHGESVARYNKRSYCSRECMYARQRPTMIWEINLKPCLHCGELVKPRPVNRSRRLCQAEYEKQKFCSHKCSEQFCSTAGRASGPAQAAGAHDKVAAEPAVPRIMDSRRVLEERLYGGKITDAYRVGFIRTVEPFTRGSHANSAAPS